MDLKDEIKDERMKVIKESKDSKGKKVVTLKKGNTTCTRLEHQTPSYIRSQE